MATTRKAAAAASTTAANLERLTQAQAAWLVGRPAVWLRDNAHLGGRNGDGTYNARELVRALAGDFRAAELPDNELEFVTQLAEDFASDCELHRSAILRMLEGIEREAGAAGLAAIGAEFLRQVKLAQLRWGVSPHAERPTPDAIRAKAEAEIRELDRWEARSERRIVLVCEKCGRHRWGRTWREPPIPSGYVESLDYCPKCEGKP